MALECTRLISIFVCRTKVPVVRGAPPRKLDICPIEEKKRAQYGGTAVFCESVNWNGSCEWDSGGEAVLRVHRLQLDELTQEANVSVSQVCWYAIQTCSRHEKLVRDRLMTVGVEPFLPLSKQYRQWSDRKMWITAPLFGGYCFARFALANSLVVLNMPGVVRIVGSAKPEPIQPEEISALQQVASADRMMEPWDYLTEGSWVEVVRGPLIGLRGQLVRRAKQHGLVIRTSLIQQAALVHIMIDEVAPI
jgi:transcription termination/antitermination protein NusG